MAETEKIPFRLIVCPECNHNFQWLGSRLPNHCPECGREILEKARKGIGVVMCYDPEATLRYKLDDAHARAHELGRQA
jgi:DNA-directed RNA polymerase subunit RPC12/RpoP